MSKFVIRVTILLVALYMIICHISAVDSKDSLVNYDKAQKILGIRTRNKFKDICDKYHIEQKTINNQPVGFLRTEIEDLKVQLELEKEKADV